MRKMIQLVSAAALLIGISTPASAAVTICLGGGCSAQPDSNVLVNAGVPGPTVSGTLNNAPGPVSFTSTEDLIGLANGPARVGAADLVLNNPLTFTYTDGLISAPELDRKTLVKGRRGYEGV